jgi:predicted HD phosphohydrolase
MMGEVTDRNVLLALLEATAATNSGFAVNDRDHAIQVATRARRAGADDEVVVAGLFHDCAKAIDVYSHGDLIGKMLAPHVRPSVVWMLRQHQDYTAVEISNGHNPFLRLLYRGRGERHALATRFVDEWDLPSRDTDYDSDPLESFYPEIDRVLAQRREVHPPLPVRLYRRILRKVFRLGGPFTRRLVRP